jgi:hypothetical protein
MASASIIQVFSAIGLAFRFGLPNANTAILKPESAPMTPSYRFIQSGGVRLRAVVEGAGPLVLMVHGFPESWYSWHH